MEVLAAIGITIEFETYNLSENNFSAPVIFQRKNKKSSSAVTNLNTRLLIIYFKTIHNLQFFICWI